MATDIQTYLRLNLVDFVKNHGYTIKDSKKSTARFLKLKHESNHSSIRLALHYDPIVYQNNDPSLNEDRGNIINFVLNRISNTITPNKSPSKSDYKEAFDYLKKYTGNISDNKPKLSVAPIAKAQPSFHKDIVDSLEPLSNPNYNYLTQSRSIAADVINNPLFKSSIVTSKYTSASGVRIQNLGFAKRDPNMNTTGVTLCFFQSSKNLHAKRIYGNPNHLWCSNINRKSNTLLISESEIDALSHFQLHKFKPSESPVYIATNGGLNDLKLQQIYLRFQQLEGPNKNLVSITDNDFSGAQYDMLLACFFLNASGDDTISFEQSQENTLFKISNSKGIDVDKLKSDTEHSLKLLPKFEFDPKDFDIDNSDNILKIKLPRDSKKVHFLHYKPLTHLIFKTAKVKFSVQKSKFHKDWNDELSKKKTLNSKLKKAIT